MRLKRLFSDLPHVNILPYLYIFVYNISRIYAITSKSTFPQHDKIYIKPSFRPSSYIVLFHPPSLFIKIRIHILFLIPARAAVKNAIQLYLLPTRKKKYLSTCVRLQHKTNFMSTLHACLLYGEHVACFIFCRTHILAKESNWIMNCCVAATAASRSWMTCHIIHREKHAGRHNQTYSIIFASIYAARKDDRRAFTSSRGKWCGGKSQ